MPIVTAAVVAIGAAIATTTVATVATAAIAVGTLVGTVGLGISVIGMATGNKTLSKIGGYLGMAGGVMGLAGGLAGGMAGYAKTLSSAWDDGVGSLFSSTKPVGQEALSAGALQEKLGKSIVDNSLAQQAAAKSATPVSATSTAPASTQPSAPLQTLGPRPQLTTPPATGASPGGVNPVDFAAGKPGVGGPDMSVTQFANAGPSGAPSATQPLASTTAQASASPSIPNMNEASNWLSVGNQVNSPASGGGGLGKFFSDLPDWAKAQVAISGAQGLAGMAGGWFESATAEEKLALEREAQQWRMRHEDQNLNFNQKNASYAPKLTFGGGGGVLSRGANS